MTDPFDRIKRPSRPPAQGGPRGREDLRGVDPQGRAALFPDRSEGGALTVHCERCDAASSLDAATALRSALPLFLVAPWRSHPVFAVCPACRRRAWLRPGIGR